MRHLTLPALLLALLSTPGCSTGPAQADEQRSEKEKRDEAALPVEVIPAFQGAIASYVTATTNLETKSEARVLAETDGVVRELLVEEGDDVKKGQPLARLDDREAQVGVARARAKSENDRAAYRRGEDLMKRDLISKDEFEKLDLARRLSEAELAQMELSLSQKTATAPFDGKVTERICRSGEKVAPGQHLFTVADFDPLIAIVHLPERQVSKLSQGTEVRASTGADAEDAEPSLRAFVAQVSPIVDAKTGTVKVTLAIPEPPKGVRPGSFVKVRLVQDAHEGAVLIPKEAVVRDLAENFVYIVDPASKGDRVDKRKVELGMIEHGLIEVTNGLDRGEKVVTVGQGGLRPKSLVRIVRERPVPQTQAQS
ncbi:MAG: efflux RND transporter periplasmic adaptor subunit [Acidobacteriota bacterium]